MGLQPTGSTHAIRKAIRISLANTGRNSGLIKRPTLTLRPCPDTSINDISPALGSTRTQSRRNSARSVLPARSNSTSKEPWRRLL